MCEIRWLSESQSSVTSSSSSSSSNIDNNNENQIHLNGGTIAGPIVILDACEKLLLFCSPLLNDTYRNTIEVALQLALDCICKGVSVELPSDRKLRRAITERIRRNPYYLNSILKLSTIELLASPKNGLMSGNGPILMRAAQCCLGLHETSAEAMKALLIVQSVLMPTAIALPPISIPVLVENRIAQKKKIDDTEKETVSWAAAWTESNPVAATKTSSEVTDSNESASVSLESRNKRSRIENEDEKMLGGKDDAEIFHGSNILSSNDGSIHLENSLARETPGDSSFSIQENMSMSVEVDVDDEENDSIPDIVGDTEFTD